MHGVGSRDLQSTVRMMFPGELGRHCVLEGVREMTSRAFRAAQEDFVEGLSKKSAYQRFFPEHVALMVCRSVSHPPLLESGAIFLATALDCVVQTILELAGSEARLDGSICISPRHILLAIRRDEDLNRVFSKHVIREGGVVPFIHPILTDVENEEGMDRTTPFEDKIIVKAQGDGSSMPCFVDPRTGLHCTVVNGELKPFPLFDIISKDDLVTRRTLAQQALSPEEMRAMKSEGYRYKRATDDGEEEEEGENDGWGRQTLAAAHMRRLREIKHMQVRIWYPVAPAHSLTLPFLSTSPTAPSLHPLTPHLNSPCYPPSFPRFRRKRRISPWSPTHSTVTYARWCKTSGCAWNSVLNPWSACRPTQNTT